MSETNKWISEPFTPYIVDTHQDIAYNAFCFNRDYRLSAERKRELEIGTMYPIQNGNAVLGLPNALQGRVAVVCATIFTAPDAGNASVPYVRVMYQNAVQAETIGFDQITYYENLVAVEPRLRIIKNNADLEAVLATWGDEQPSANRIQGLIIAMENADPILTPRDFGRWHERGLRVVGPAWVASRYSGGTSMPGGLTPLGYDLLREMMVYRVVLDVSHMAEQAFYDSLNFYEGSIIASHSNPRYFKNTDRHLSDDMIRLLASRDGVMGIALYNLFLDNNWGYSTGKNAITLTRVVEVIDYICQLTGSCNHVGIGSDFDGGFGVESIPAEIDTVADVWRIKDALQARGYTDEDVYSILGGNMLRKLRQAL